LCCLWIIDHNKKGGMTPPLQQIPAKPIRDL
jgi:hypothetical protein